MTHPRAFSSNGVRRSRSDMAHRSDVPNWRQPARSGYPQSQVSSNSSSPPSSGGRHHQQSSSAGEEDEFHAAGNRGGAHDNPLHGRLLFLTMCLVGQVVDVHLKDGAVYSGIFHTANVDKDFGVVLKMAKLTKEPTGKVKGDPKQQPARRPVKLLIVYARDLVQIAAKEVHLTGESFPNGRAKDTKGEFLTDLAISQSRRGDTERQLTPWMPDGEAPRNLDLESTFQNPSHRNWDQFQTNKDLFGIESTFNEDLYTTKLGPQTKEREREASRLAREIENEAPRSHPADDRFGHDADDEESRYSSVLRRNYDDADEDGHSKNDELNDETFGSVPSQSPAPVAPSHDASPRSSVSAGDGSAPLDSARKGGKDPVESSKVKSSDRDLKPPEPKPSSDVPSKHIQPPISPPPASALPNPVGLSPSAAPSSSSRTPVKPAASSPLDLSRSSSLDAFREDGDAASSGSSGGGAKKFSLNPNAKEFKLNPNAKVFTPTGSPAAPRPVSPVNQQQNPVYVHTQVPIQVPVGYVPHGQPAQYGQYTNTIAATGVTAAPYIQPSAFGPSAPPQTQPQANAAPYGQQQMRYMQAAHAYPHPNYPQPVIYSHQPPFIFLPQYHQAMMQPQPVVTLTAPGPPPAQAQQRGDGLAPSPVQSPLPSPVPRSQQQPAQPGSSSGNAPKPNGGPRGNKN